MGGVNDDILTETQRAVMHQVQALLEEHFDCALVLALMSEAGLSQVMEKGCGNWYAQYGMICEKKAQMEANFDRKIPEPESEDE